ncbi:MAG: hypothetical protein RIC55_02880 [Pirellulaceae bacterium]
MDDPQGYRPTHSDLLRKPIVGDDGVNPFSDPALAPKEPTQAAESDNLYSPPAGDDGPAYRPAGYVATLVPRSRRVFRFGLIGLIVAIVAAIAMATSLPSFGASELANITATLALVLSLVDLALTLGASLFGMNELKAIKAGAVEGSNRAQTWIGIVLGLMGTLIAILTAAAFVYDQILSPMLFLSR